VTAFRVSSIEELIGVDEEFINVDDQEVDNNELDGGELQESENLPATEEVDENEEREDTDHGDSSEYRILVYFRQSKKTMQFKNTMMTMMPTVGKDEIHSAQMKKMSSQRKAVTPLLG
jgi:hypothetical protein